MTDATPDLTNARRAPATVARMAGAADEFLAALRAEQRAVATAPFDTPDHREWTYLPGPRPGLALAEMDDRQRDLALALLATGLSEQGLRTAESIRWLEGVLRDLERDGGRAGWERRDPAYFWVRVLGEPGGDRPWGWRIGGHHLGCHLTIVGDAVAATPQFFGANPAIVPSGPHAGFQTLSQEERLARELLGSLGEDERAAAIVSEDAPDDILTRRDPVADPDLVPRGLAHAEMPAAARLLLERLVRLYVERVAPELAAASWRTIERAGLETVTFAWAGGRQRGVGHYYAVSGPTFLLEYDNTQSGANHVHTVWRDLRDDWGADLLAEHYAAHHA